MGSFIINPNSTDIWRNDNVIITSKRRRFGVIMMLLLRRVSTWKVRYNNHIAFKLSLSKRNQIRNMKDERPVYEHTVIDRRKTATISRHLIIIIVMVCFSKWKILCFHGNLHVQSHTMLKKIKWNKIMIVIMMIMVMMIIIVIITTSTTTTLTITITII